MSEKECRDVALLRLYKVYGQRIFHFSQMSNYELLMRSLPSRNSLDAVPL
jgi:hypothetical protein